MVVDFIAHDEGHHVVALVLEVQRFDPMVIEFVGVLLQAVISSLWY